jgi:hypothetical protein
LDQAEAVAVDQQRTEPQAAQRQEGRVREERQADDAEGLRQQEQFAVAAQRGQPRTPPARRSPRASPRQ